MNSQATTIKKFMQMDSVELLNSISSDKLSQEDAKLAALIVEARFPTPLSKEEKKMRLIDRKKRLVSEVSTLEQQLGTLKKRMQFLNIV